jgi:AcrR family transcriptional regulator
MMAAKRDGDARPELRAAILESATRMFLQQPFDAVRIDDIANDAGVAKGLAFYYFENKRGIYAAVVESLLMQLVERSRPDTSLPPREREIAAVGAFVDWAAGTPGIEHILTNWAAVGSRTDALFRAAAEAITAQTIAAMADMPGGPGRADELPEPLLGRTIWGWLAFARVVTADWLRNPDIERDQLCDLLVAALDGVVIGARAVAQR